MLMVFTCPPIALRSRDLGGGGCCRGQVFIWDPELSMDAERGSQGVSSLFKGWVMVLWKELGGGL